MSIDQMNDADIPQQAAEAKLAKATAAKYKKLNPARGVFLRFARALFGVAAVSKFGTKKHNVPIDDMSFAWLPGANALYLEAECRHILREAIEGPVDDDFNLLHKAHKAWDALADLEVALQDIEEKHGRKVMYEVIEGLTVTDPE